MSVKKIKEGQWQARWRDSEGKQRAKRFPTKNAARDHEAAMRLAADPASTPAAPIAGTVAELAAQWLERRFGPEVVEPVRLHVDAKRFLCATEKDYIRFTGKQNAPYKHIKYLENGESPLKTALQQPSRKILKSLNPDLFSASNQDPVTMRPR